MRCEIEFLAVGDASRAGDAIVIRYGEPDGWNLILVDGGTSETGEAIVEHLRKQYGTATWIDHMVLTHSDADHASGLREVMRQMEVRNLWLHVPWVHASEAIHLFNAAWTVDRLEKAIKAEYDIVADLLQLAATHNPKCEWHFPFQSETIGPFTVLSPSRSTYVHLLPQFDKTPEPNLAAIQASGLWINKASRGLLARAMAAVAAKVEKWVTESWTGERLRDGGVTSASNESSVVLYANIDNGGNILLTGDAGIRALTWAADYADARSFPLQNFDCVQVPHHGSRRNVGPTILNRLLGPIQPEGGEGRFLAYVSAPKDDENHPRKIVLNAFIRRGGQVLITQGTSKVYWGGFPPRAGYITATPASFSSTVEEYS